MTPRPRLRGDIVTVRQVERGETVHVYKTLEPPNYYRFDTIQHDLLRLLDGSRTLEEVATAFNAKSPIMTVDVAFLEKFVGSLKDVGLLESTPAEKNVLLLEKIRQDRRRRAARKSLFGNILDIRLSAWNPDRYLRTIHPWLRFLYTPVFLVVSVACVLIMLGIWVSEWERMKAGTMGLFTFQGKTGADILQFFLILFVVSFLHESAHGLTCKHFGGTVPQMGFMIIYFTPCFFVDVSDSYMFDRHYKKQWTIFAGGYIEMVVCSLATFVWCLTSPGTLVHELAWKTLLMTGLLSIVVNYNPLIKLDGYYALMDCLEVPDLWERSSEYTAGWIKKNVFQLPVEIETPAPKERRILFGYCLLSVVYKVVLITVALVFLKNIAVGLFGAAGYVVLSLAVMLALRRPLLKLGGLLRFAILDKKEVLMTRRTLLGAGAGSALALGLMLLVPVPVTFEGPCRIEPGRTAVVRSEVEGRIGRVLVQEGQEVRRGDPLAVLESEPHALALAALRDRLRLSGQEIAEAADRNDPALLTRRSRERDLLEEQERALRAKAARLVLRAPLDGVVATPRLHESVGIYLTVGQDFCEITGKERPVARVPVREYRLDEIALGQKVRMLFPSHPFTTRRGEVVALAPAAKEAGPVPASPPRPTEEPPPGRAFSDFEAIVELDGEPDGLRYGMEGRARIRVGYSTMARRFTRAWQRWFRARIWW